MQRHWIVIPLACAALTAAAWGQGDFKKEGNAEQRAVKDALEGKAPPALQVTDWINAPEGGLRLADLKGQVVVLDFWGTW